MEPHAKAPKHTISSNWSEISQGVWNSISTFYLLVQSPWSFMGSNWLVVTDVCMISLRNTSCGSSWETVARVIKEWYKWKCLVHHGKNHSQSLKKFNRTPTPDQTLSSSLWGGEPIFKSEERQCDKTHWNSRSAQKQYVVYVLYICLTSSSLSDETEALLLCAHFQTTVSHYDLNVASTFSACQHYPIPYPILQLISSYRSYLTFYIVVYTVDSLITHSSDNPYSLVTHTFFDPPSW